jgi:hypothetical protein
MTTSFVRTSLAPLRPAFSRIDLYVKLETGPDQHSCLGLGRPRINPPRTIP